MELYRTVHSRLFLVIKTRWVEISLLVVKLTLQKNSWLKVYIHAELFAHSMGILQDFMCNCHVCCLTDRQTDVLVLHYNVMNMEFVEDSTKVPCLWDLGTSLAVSLGHWYMSSKLSSQYSAALFLLNGLFPVWTLGNASLGYQRTFGRQDARSLDTFGKLRQARSSPWTRLCPLHIFIVALYKFLCATRCPCPPALPLLLSHPFQHTQKVVPIMLFSCCGSQKSPDVRFDIGDRAVT